MSRDKEIYMMGDSAYLKGSQTLVVTMMNDYDIGFIEDRKVSGNEVTPAKGSCTSKVVTFMPFGSDDKLPLQIMGKSGINTIVGSNIDFKAKLAYGDGLTMFRRVKDKTTGEIKVEEILQDEYPEIDDFLKECNYMRVMQELANDLVVFGDAFVYLSFGRREKGKPAKIVYIRHREMSFSRISKQDEKSRRIEYHGYSSQWGDQSSPDDCIVTRLLDRATPLHDLKVRTARIPDPNTGEKNDEGANGYTISLNMPIPGRFYYNKPYWWSIFVDWFDFSCAIPKFKKSLMKNQMVLKYHVTINEDFWPKYYDSLGVKGDTKKMDEAKKKFLNNLNDFLSGEANAGKSFVSHFRYDQINKFEENDIVIKPLESFIKGGEYIEDSEEATNVICNTMSVHPSLKGASPGSTKTINGTEARELFIIAQALMKPERDMMVLPLYMAKELNGWPKDIEFGVKNTMLTTLDQGTGAVKSIGNQEV